MIGVLVSGEGTNLQALIDEGLPIAAVASNRADAKALERADSAGIPTAAFELDEYDSREQRDAAMADWLVGHGVTLVVCAGYMHLLRSTFLERFERIVNTHSAPLPDFPGAHPIEDVLAAGVPETAATVHYVDQGVDSGPVITAERVPVHEDDTVETLRARVQAVEHRLLPRAVRELLLSSASWGAAGGAGPEGTVPTSTGPESTVPSAASGGGEAGLRPAGADAGQGGEE